MEYFRISEMDGPCISVSAGFDKNIQAIYQERLGDVEDMCMYHVQVPESICMPDVVFRPTFMVSEPCWECIRYYEPYLEARRCLLYAAGYGEIFYIPLLDVLEVPFDKRILFNRHMYRVLDKHSKQIVVSLELLESILRRQFIGFHVNEL